MRRVLRRSRIDTNPRRVSLLVDLVNHWPELRQPLLRVFAVLLVSPVLLSEDMRPRLRQRFAQQHVFFFQRKRLLAIANFGSFHSFNFLASQRAEPFNDRGIDPVQLNERRVFDVLDLRVAGEQRRNGDDDN